MFFDSHCHLTSDELAPDFAGVLMRARVAGVTHFLNIGDDLDSSRAALQQARESDKHGVSMHATAGFHPQNAARFDADSVARLRDLAAQSEIVAIGEIGLDWVYDETHAQHPGATREVQERVFRAQIELALELDLPVVIHNRDADDDLLRIVESYSDLRGVFHCFGSSIEVARRVLQRGFHLGFTGLVTFKNADAVRAVAKMCPLDRLLIETDAPYLAPIPFRGKTNEPAFLPRIAQQIAALHNATIQQIAKTSTTSARRLFNLDSDGAS